MIHASKVKLCAKKNRSSHVKPRQTGQKAMKIQRNSRSNAGFQVLSHDDSHPSKEPIEMTTLESAGTITMTRIRTGKRCSDTRYSIESKEVLHAKFLATDFVTARSSRDLFQILTE
jgi:hypothetical protein